LNRGKLFELALKKSVPDYALLYRLPDAAQSFGCSNNLRFSRKNPFDFFLFDSMRGILYGIEAKTVNGKSISFERNKSESGVIHYHQIQGLKEYSSYENTVFGFVIEFREIETTVFIKIEDFDLLINTLDKKSFNYNDLKDSGLDYYIIPQTKKRTQYTYDLDHLLKTIGEEKESK
jgi:hypothetical protein